MQYVSIKDAKGLAYSWIELLVGSDGYSCNATLTETINGLHITDLIHRRGPWRSFEAVAYPELE